MALQITIDTATPYGAVAVADEGQVLHAVETHDQRDHATFLHTAIAEVLQQSKVKLQDIDAVTVTIGPGSYTGLRVGLSAAKGLCYALKKPLIAINTLQAIALAATQQTHQQTYQQTDKTVLVVPMIDARRMEVFTAVYDLKNELHTPPAAVVIDQDFFASIRSGHFLVFAGNGSSKLLPWQLTGDHAFSNNTHTIRHVAILGEQYYGKEIFENIAYCEPLYLKPFFSTGFVKK